MGKLARFGVSLDQELLEKFDEFIRGKGYPNRSKAIGDLIGDFIVSEEWRGKRNVVGVLVLVYDHRKRGVVDKLLNIQHEHHESIFATMHVHLNEDNCLEVIVARGKPDGLKKLADRMVSIKGVKYGRIIKATTGKLLA
jgi:CopG family nickel-responsive transcriptional regulator